jgi:hypothetical protein
LEIAIFEETFVRFAAQRWPIPPSSDALSAASFGRSSKSTPGKGEASRNHAAEKLECPENVSLKRKSIGIARRSPEDNADDAAR